MPLRTACKIAWRELRASPAKFFFVIIAVAVGVAALSGVKGFGFAFKGMLLKNAKQLIAADVQARTFILPDPDQFSRLQAFASKYGTMTQVTELLSMADSPNERIPQMVAVKAVDPKAYPYYGKPGLSPQEPIRKLLPNDSSVLVTPELLLRLKVAPGGSIRLGGRVFHITGKLLAEPDRLASGFGPGMRAMMTRAGRARTGLIRFGSRASQRFLFKLNPGANLDDVKADLKSVLPRAAISDYREGSPAVGKAIDDTTRFLSLISLIALIVGALGVAMGMHAHLQQRMDTIAIMKAVGARTSQVMKIYLVQTLWLGLAGGLIGIAVGALVQSSFPLLMQGIFAFLPQVPWDWSFSLQGLSLGILATLLFTEPPLLSIRNVRPSLVFRRNMSDAALHARRRWYEKIPAVAGAVLALFGFSLIAVWLSGSWKMGAYFMGGLAGSVIALTLIAALLLTSMRHVTGAFSTRLPASFRHGFANLYRPGSQARAVLVALGVGVMFTASTYLVQDTVLRAVQNNSPGETGNLFLIDIRDTHKVTKFVEAQPGISGKLKIIGYIMGKVVAKNGVPADQLKLSKKKRNDLQMVRIATAQSLPYGLALHKGHWWKPDDKQPALAISEEVEKKFHLKLGDRVEFETAGRTVDAPLVAIFRREWRAPANYNLIVPLEAMRGFPVTYYGAVHANAAQIPSVEQALFQRFPTITVMNLADVLDRIRNAIDQVAVVIRFLGFFAIAAGIIILCASVAGTRYRRIREVAILKTLGGTRRQIRSVFSIEFSILGAVAGLIGGILANAFTFILSKEFIHAPFHFDWPLLGAAVGLTVLLANAAGWLASARILNQRPLVVLREE
jgi:putative ABC transport system permease protein